MSQQNQATNPFQAELDFFRDIISELQKYRDLDDGHIVLTPEEIEGLESMTTEHVQSFNQKKMDMTPEGLAQYSGTCNSIYFLNEELCAILDNASYMDSILNVPCENSYVIKYRPCV